MFQRVQNKKKIFLMTYRRHYDVATQTSIYRRLQDDVNRTSARRCKSDVIKTSQIRRLQDVVNWTSSRRRKSDVLKTL